MRCRCLQRLLRCACPDLRWAGTQHVWRSLYQLPWKPWAAPRPVAAPCTRRPTADARSAGAGAGRKNSACVAGWHLSSVCVMASSCLFSCECLSTCANSDASSTPAEQHRLALPGASGTVRLAVCCLESPASRADKSLRGRVNSHKHVQTSNREARACMHAEGRRCDKGDHRRL